MATLITLLNACHVEQQALSQQQTLQQVQEPQ